MKTLFQYFEALGYKWVFLFSFLFVLMMSAKYSGVWWIRDWSEMNDSNLTENNYMNTNTRLSVYGLFGVVERNNKSLSFIV